MARVWAPEAADAVGSMLVVMSAAGVYHIRACVCTLLEARMRTQLYRRGAAPIVTVAFAAAVGSIGCGGATASNLFDPPPSADAGPDVTVQDAAQDVRKDVTPDAPPPPSPVIACGPPLDNPQNKCDASKKEFCCRRGDAQPFKYGCETDPTACQDFNDVPIQCSSTQTCIGVGLIGSVCCGTLVASGVGGSVITNTTCTAPASCVSGGSLGKAILCDPGQPNNCPNGGTCKLSSQTMPGDYLCI